MSLELEGIRYSIDDASAHVIGQNGANESGRLLPRSVIYLKGGRFDVASFRDSCFRQSPLKEILVPRHVGTLHRSCFESCKSLRYIGFEFAASLRRIEDDCFYQSALQTLVIPLSVSSIKGSAFLDCRFDLIGVPDNHPHFVIRDLMLVDIQLHAIVRYFGPGPDVLIPNDIEIIAESCFQNCKQIETVTFQQPSILKRIEESAFVRSSLKAIRIPESVELIEGTPFAFCTQLEFSIDDENANYSMQDAWLPQPRRKPSPGPI
jgi:hypothetical protein